MGYFIIMFSNLILKRQCYYTLYYLLNVVTFIFFLVYIPHYNAVIFKTYNYRFLQYDWY